MIALKILILEDDVLFAAELELVLRELGYTVLPVQDNVPEALRLVERDRPDIILADIHVKGEETGIDLGRALMRSGIPIIFITSDDDPARYEQARGVAPEAYLVKPFDQLTLQGAIEMALIRKGQPLLISQVIDHWTKNSLIRQYLFVRKGSGMVKIKSRELDYIEADGNYCYLYSGGHKYAVKISLRRLKEKLDPSLFLRVSRNYMVNFLQIEEVDLVNSQLIVGGRTLAIGNTYRAEIESWMNRV